MKKVLLTLLCVAGLMLWGAVSVSAVQLHWTLLEHSSVAGKGPGADGVIGTGDDTLTGEVNKCNFTTVANCPTAGNPTIGTYSFSAIEFDAALPYSCFDPNGGATSGAPCTCAEGGACISDADCTSSSCAGAGDCCPGIFNLCTECTKIPGASNDSFSYFGSHATLGPAPHLTTCQVGSGGGYDMTAFKTASTESLTGLGGTCITLNMANAPYAGTPCGTGPITGTMDVDVYAVGCDILGTTINNITYTGNIIDMSAPTASSCGYTLAQVNTLIANAHAADASAAYLLVLCGETTVPMDSKTACLRNAHVDFVVVAYTDDNAADCSGTCP